MSEIRPNWDKYFLSIAAMVATRSTCDRANVGCVLVKDGRIISTGCNGSPAGHNHCSEKGHLMRDGHCIRTVHAEVNAIIQAALNGISPEGAFCYATHFPCYSCAKMLINAQIQKVVFGKFYGDSFGAAEDIFRRSEIEIVRINGF